MIPEVIGIRQGLDSFRSLANGASSATAGSWLTVVLAEFDDATATRPTRGATRSSKKNDPNQTPTTRSRNGFMSVRLLAMFG